MQITRASGLAWRTVGGETIVIHLANKMMYGLNKPGGRIWEAIGDSTTFENLVRLLPREAGTEDIMRRSLESFLAGLAREGLIVTDAEFQQDVEEPVGPADPRITWREEIRRFAGASCAKYPGVSTICSTNPEQ